MSENKDRTKEESKKKLLKELEVNSKVQDKLKERWLNKNKKVIKKISMDNPKVYKEETLKSLNRLIKEEQDILNKLELNIKTLYEKAKNKLKEGDKYMTKCILIKINETDEKIRSISYNLDSLEKEKIKYETEDINKIINEIKKRETGVIFISPVGDSYRCDEIKIKEEIKFEYILSDEIYDFIDYKDEEQKDWVEEEFESLEEEMGQKIDKEDKKEQDITDYDYKLENFLAV